jgi:hypothetical protein
MPSSGPFSPAASRASAAPRWPSACSAVTVIKALRLRVQALDPVQEMRVSSTLEIRFALGKLADG